MLRTIFRSNLVPTSLARSRNFVSSALLTKTWDDKSVNDLRQEAKKRGLSPKGNKATLITRLQNDDERRAVPPASATSQASQPVRQASTAEVPGMPTNATSPPTPPSFPKDFLEVKLPDLSKPAPQHQVQIPFLPDLWDSSRVKAESAPQVVESETIPKMIAVAGAATHPGGGPSHKVYVPSESTAPEAQESTQGSRPLDSEETRGVWMLLGLLTGSWLAAGYFKTPSAFETVHKTEETSTDKTPAKH
ncbi:hypothetical protein CERSUDRAFT_113530 [Gelatoporia subvermispora B]|uniref:SAP domain-containing protein n=1 Tax=Ceriporiopsis subvermispora (strain B) TaxID=914234 RepID=M2RHU2_CERS8|nr:hypothetical protein CERSUDRAFT_113530 [Gelatoporia subvermispora B]